MVPRRLMKDPEVVLFAQRARVEHIVGVLIRYGVADMTGDADEHRWLAKLAGHAKPDPRLLAMSRGERLCAAAQELGTVFVKIGQILSTRADLVGADTAHALQALQADDPADTPDQIAATVAGTLNVAVDDAFSAFGSFDTTPIASASIGQVCRATTAEGRDVVVKVRHAGIVDQVDSDVQILQALADVAEKESARARELGVSRIVSELVESLQQELDFHHELLNLQVIAANFAGSTEYAFPEALPDLSGEAVLTETALEGTRLSDVIGDLGARRDTVIRQLAALYFKMIFEDGLFHADPHPGNLLLLPEGRLGVLDFGKCGRLLDDVREAFVDFLAAVFGDDLEEVTRCLLVVAPGPATLDTDLLSRELAVWKDRFFPSSGVERDNADLGAAVSALLDMANRYSLRLPNDVAMMLMVVVELQGILEETGTSLRLSQLLLPFAARLRSERLSPRRLWRSATRRAHRWEHLLDVLPGDLARIVEAGSRSELKVPLAVEGLDRPINRMAYALVTAATIQGATSLLARGTAPTYREVSVPGLVGTGVSAYLAVHILRSIRRSGGV
ncbi:MAG: AarF/ABC1/UbiB kinase family protein [Actinobacteria bacterium]|nr:AarF/ABC1/UbiB kinase family protein [Actinomycetota bacterium]MCB9412199.1 AarF/ABC1/UbiB kinase family protein [Actinomycetota bacterium]